jgi:ketosteroid isomerase-like protein
MTIDKYAVDSLGPPPGTASGVKGTVSLRKAVDEIRRLHVAAINGGDVEGAISLFAADGVLLPPGQPVVIGLAQMRRWFTVLFERVEVRDFVIQPEDGQAHGNAFIEHGTWSAMFQPKSGAPAVPGGGTYMTLYTRGADGRVRITKDIFNGLPVD